MLIHKSLYLANSIEGLQVLAAKGNENFKGTRKLEMWTHYYALKALFNHIFYRLCRAADKLYKNIHSDPLDEEKTYIFLYRFLLIYKHLKTTENDKAFIELRFGKEADKARAELIQLEQKLTDRYKELENDKLQKELQETEKSRVVAETTSKTFFNQGFVAWKTRTGCNKNTCVSALAITCLELLQVLGKTKNVLVIDVRSAGDYHESHIKSFENINIPENLIVTG